MAHQPPPTPDIELHDALNVAPQFVASMNNQGSGPNTGPLDSSLQTNPGDYFNQLTSPNMVPLPSPNATTTLPYHESQQHGVNLAQPDVTDRQPSLPAEKDGDPDEPEVDFPHENAQQDAQTHQETGQVGTDVTTAGPQGEISSENSSNQDMSDGSESRVSPESEEDLDRLDKYAFNYVGQAYDHRVPQHLTGGTTLFAKKVIQGIAILEHLESAESQDKGSVCPKLEPEEVEMKRTAKAVECIWVGMLPNPQGDHKHAASASVQPESLAGAASSAVQDDGHNSTETKSNGTSNNPKKVQKRAKKGKPIIDLEDDELDIIPYTNNAFRVVAKKMTRTVKTWHLYALATSDSDSELCEGWRVYFDEVFFFKAFRDDTVAGFMKRKHTSDERIKAVIFPAKKPLPLVPQTAPLAKRSASDASAPATPTPGGLPSPKSSGRKAKASRTVRDASAKQACKDGDMPDQEVGDAGSPVGNLEEGNGFDADNLHAARNERQESKRARQETTHPKRAGIIYDDGDEDSYPDYAVSATNACYKNFLDDMVRELSVVGPSGADIANGKQGEKRKRVAFESSCGDVANTRKKLGDNSRGSVVARDGLEREGSDSFVVQQHTDHLARKLTSIINKLAAKQDVAGLHQCVTMVESIEKRGRPDPASALAPYLNTTSKRDATRRACCAKLREILVGFLQYFVFSFHRGNANQLLAGSLPQP